MADVQPGRRAALPNHVYRLTVPDSDTQVQEWLKKQYNPSFSLRLLVKEAIAMHGIEDAFSSLSVPTPHTRREYAAIIDSVGGAAPATTTPKADTPAPKRTAPKVESAATKPTHAKHDVSDSGLVKSDDGLFNLD